MVDETLLQLPFRARLGGAEEVEQVGSLNACVVRSESEGGSVRGKLVIAFPCRWCKRRSICSVSTLRLQPSSRALLHTTAESRDRYLVQKNAVVEPRGFVQQPAAQLARSGQAAAKARMYLRLRGENPRMSGNASRRSCERRSTVPAPQPSRSWRARIALPMSQ